jgi:phage gp37-like protein
MSLDVSETLLGILSTLEGDAELAALAAHIGPFQDTFPSARQRGVVVRLPAILVSHQGGDIRHQGMSRWVHEARWGVTLCCRNLRSPSAALTGTTGEVGVQDLLPHVMRLLAGQRMEGAASDLEPLGLEPLHVDQGQGYAEYGLVFGCNVFFERVNDTVALEEIRLTTHHRHAGGDTEVATDVLEDLEI